MSIRVFKPIAGALSISLLIAGCFGGFRGGAEEHPGWGPNEYYADAKRALRDEDWREAVQKYNSLEARYPYGRYAEQAIVERAYALWKDGNPDQALVELDRFIRLYPTHRNVDYAYYLKGLVNYQREKSALEQLIAGEGSVDRDVSSTRDAFEAFRELVNRFPSSQYVEDARLRMADLLEHMARQEIAIARYYLQLDANVAAVNRCKYVIEHYQQTPLVEDALGIMVVAYRRMGLPDLAADSARVLAQNFPSSPYLADELAAVSGRSD